VRRSYRILAAVGCFLLGAVFVWLLGRNSPSRDALLKYKAESQGKGEKLTFDELTKSRSASTNTSYQTITNLGRKLGPPALSPSLITLRRYVAPGSAQVAWTSGSGAETNGPPPQIWEQFAIQLSQTEPALAEMRLALKNPPPDAGPWPKTNTWTSRYDFVAIRQTAYWYSAAALSELRQGKREAALQDVEALAGLARMDRDEYTLVAQMIRIAVAGLGLMTTWEALQAPGWTEPQLARLQRGWEQVELADAVEKGLLGERASATEVWRLVRQESGHNVWRNLRLTSGGASTALNDYVLLPLYKVSSINDDELLHLQLSQECLDAVRLVQQHRPWPEVQQRLALPLTRLKQLGSWPASFRYRITAITMPNFPKALDIAVQRETERQLTITAIALRRFQLRRGALPKQLDELIPDFLAASPTDPLSGKNLNYRTNGGGGFVLYSVGLDGKDDGGDPVPAAGNTPGLWEGRDAVWPLAAP
jgi:hypothetical protein